MLGHSCDPEYSIAFFGPSCCTFKYSYCLYVRGEARTLGKWEKEEDRFY